MKTRELNFALVTLVNNLRAVVCPSWVFWISQLFSIPLSNDTLLDHLQGLHIGGTAMTPFPVASTSHSGGEDSIKY